jgi:hypothetical protein
MKVTRKTRTAIELAGLVVVQIFCLWLRLELGQLMPWFEISRWSRILAAGLAAIAAGVLALPLILLRRRYLQTQ